jgi:hypothetical protein
MAMPDTPRQDARAETETDSPVPIARKLITARSVGAVNDCVEFGPVFTAELDTLNSSR